MPLPREVAALSELNAVDAFCGAGGLSYGLAEAGFAVDYAFDNNAKAIDTYKNNIGQHAEVADADELSGSLIRRKTDTHAFTLLAGGPPCQGFSVQRRGSATDVRNDLIFQFVRLVEELQPSIFLMENVAALASPKNEAYLGKFLAAAEKAGYVLDVHVINAADFGVPQIRKRLFVLGTSKKLSRQLFLPRTPVVNKWATVQDAFMGLPRPAKPTIVPNHLPDNMSPLNRERISHVPAGGGRADIPVHLRLPCHAIPVEKSGHRGVYGRLDWEKPAGTVTTKCNSFTRGRFAHPVEDRNITMREAARLQSFPDDFVFVGGTVDVAHQVGNAVPPLLAYEVARHLVEQIGELYNEEKHRLIQLA